ncbi:hypothetical protein G3480_23105 [Thiorhodococcus mannitoliphagus]|uniref:Zinc-ribbon domain-containing protein n=1 Tax=Thiorhodococcus mannitoliphagus TaxID=329406 RepID=A0A6P1E056_9GAMM|nr:putative zinc-binding metallopeptidase [Thiorhodococcus mannitoliphagus]NEX23150.1 hypothetical protein [Thiorhodococcus mannitoliphagus]
MKTFCCQLCGQPVYFENTQCMRCGATLGFLPDEMRLSALVESRDDLWGVPEGRSGRDGGTASSGALGRWLRRRSQEPALTAKPRKLYRKCGNYSQYGICNWMVPATQRTPFCMACQPSQIIPSLNRPGNLQKWARIERSKRRLMYGLLRLGLPITTKFADPEAGLGFAFLSSLDAPQGEQILTGHVNGLITINIDEADPALREQVRLDMDEKYRTLLGHFRHEIGHYYWDRLIRDAGRLDAFRAGFGDERLDYAQAQSAHYASGAPADWQERFISAYASMHPWEDWAETWAHYLHIVDTLETSEHFGISVSRRMPDGSRQQACPDFDPYTIKDFQPIIDTWIPLTFALNSINRSMGQPDHYPFVLSPPVIAKLEFIHDLIRESRVGISP